MRFRTQSETYLENGKSGRDKGYEIKVTVEEGEQMKIQRSGGGQCM